MSQVFTKLQDVRFDLENSDRFEIQYVVVNGRHQGEQSKPNPMSNVYISPSLVDRAQIDRDDFENRKTEPCNKNRFSNIEEGLVSSLGNEAKDRISRILNDVKGLSDVEKLLLYLKLPSGDTANDELRQTPTSCLHVSNRVEQAQAYTWIKSHLEEDVEICLPKQEVFDDYRLYCDHHSLKNLSTADFGKVMKCVFPNVKPRRLGQRGQSRYCYGGLRKKLDIGPPELPELEISPRKQQLDQKNEDDEMFSASCTLVCEWAQRLLGNNFSTVRELAEYLVGNLYVNSKSVAAFTLIAGMQEAGIQNQKVSSLFSNTTGGDRHRETQLQLQRKLQERELVREQKRKIQQQKEENEQQFRMSLDRHTPLIFSPTLQQDGSPARRIFDDDVSRIAGDSNRCKSVVCASSPSPARAMFTEDTSEVSLPDSVAQRSKSVVCISTSLPMTKTCRSKSVVTDADTKSIKVNTESNQEISKQVAMDTSDYVTMETSSVVNLTCSKEKNIGMTNIRILNNSVVEDKHDIVISGNQGNLDIHGNGNKTVHSESATVPSLHTVKKPSFVLLGNPSIFNQREPVSCINLSHKPQGSIQNKCIEIQCSEKTNEEISKVHINSGSRGNSGVIENKGGDISNKDMTLFINPTAVSSRSAFVPFSQVQSRKEISDEMKTSSFPNSEMSDGSITMKHITNKETESNSFPTPSIQYTDNLLTQVTQSVCVTNQVDSVKSATPSTKCNESILSGMPLVLMPSSLSKNESQNSQELQKNFLSSKHIELDVVKLSPASTAPLNNSAEQGEVVMTVSESQFSQPALTSPSKKAPKSRFTPIRPKASPTKNVSTIIKEQKGVSADVPTYDTRTVATLLKEKRAREADAVQKKKPVNQSLSLTPNIQTLALPALSPSGTGDFVIILNSPQTFSQNVVSSASQTLVSTLTTATVSMTISNCRPIVHTQTAPPAAQRFVRVRTNSSSERELDSPLPTSQDTLNTSDLSEGYMSATDDEKPSKMAKIIDNDQNVSSRPGSRCSPDRETPSFSGRKRKFFNVGGTAHTRKRINSIDDEDDDVIICEQKDWNKDQRRTRSCTFDMDESDSGTKVSGFGNADIIHCPDISSLESDALLDNAESVLLLSNTKNRDSLSKQVHSTAVGVNSLSLRQSQQQLLKQKQMLDERMKFFLQKESDDRNNSSPVLEKAIHQTVQETICGSMMSGETSLTTNENIGGISLESEAQKMDVGEDIPPEVVDFITEKLTGITNSNVPGYELQVKGQSTNSNVPGYELQVKRQSTNSNVPGYELQVKRQSTNSNVPGYELQVKGQSTEDLNQRRKMEAEFLEKTFQASEELTKPSTDIIDQGNQSFLLGKKLVSKSRNDQNGNTIEGLFGITLTSENTIESMCGTTSANTGQPKVNRNNGTIEKYLNQPPMVRSEMSLKDNFVSPQMPARRQRTPSVEKIISQQMNSFGSSSQPLQRNREGSVEGKQTPSSDAGYFSIGSSPVSYNTAVLRDSGCESHSLLTRNPSSLMLARPDSAQSLTSEPVVPQSPIPQLSPRFHTSTPLLKRSPCPTPNQGLLLSPTDGTGGSGQGTAFMPIQGGTTYKINSNVTLIKPVVTVASSQGQGQTIGQGQIMQDLIGIGSIQPENKEKASPRCPPPYSKAVQSINFDKSRQNVGSNGAFGSINTIKPPLYSSKNGSCEGQSQVMGQSQGHIMGQGQPPLYSSKNDSCDPLTISNNDSNMIPTYIPKKTNVSSENYLPFSSYMALLSRRAQKDLKTNADETKGIDIVTEQEGEMKDSSVGTVLKDSSGQLVADAKTSVKTGRGVVVGGDGSSAEVGMATSVVDGATSSVMGSLHAVVGGATSLVIGSPHAVNQPEKRTVNWTGENNPLQAQIKPHDKPNIESILNLLKSYENISCPTSDTTSTVPESAHLTSLPMSVHLSSLPHSLSTSVHITSLPSSNYSGNTPNINLATMLPSKEKVSITDINKTPTVENVRRNLNDLLDTEHRSEINEAELQSTLDDLRSVDSQYFGQDDLQLECPQRL